MLALVSIRSGARDPTALRGLSLAHWQPFLAKEPMDPVDTRRPALAAQEHEDPPIARPSAFG